MTITLIILGWLICSALSHGMMFSYLQKEFPTVAKTSYREQLATTSVVSALFGPIALLSALVTTGFAKHGLKFK